MCINRECKEFITKPSADYINQTALFLPIRASAMKNIENQLFPERKNTSFKPITTIHATDPESKKLEGNVHCQLKKLDSSSLATNDSTELCYLFNQKTLSSEQVHDLMNFRSIGQREYDLRVKSHILRNPSANPPKHRKSLLTFTERRGRKKKGSEIEREKKLQLECWKKRVAFAMSTGAQVNTSYEQCLELPRAIATIDGKPVNSSGEKVCSCNSQDYHNIIKIWMDT